MRTFDLPFVLRSPLWPLILAALVGFVLVLGIQQVVRQAVRDGEVRRQVVAAHAEAMWRCNFHRGKDKRDACRAQANAAQANATPRENTSPQAESARSLAQVER